MESRLSIPSRLGKINLLIYQLNYLHEKYFTINLFPITFPFP